MGLVLLLAARVWAIQGKKERGEVDCCGMEGGLGSIWRMQYLGLSTAMLADVCLVSEFAVCNLTAGLEMQRLVSIDNTYSSSTYCFWRNGKSRSQRLRNRSCRYVPLIIRLIIVGNFGIGYTMRFPRCRYIYWDKASRDHPTGDDTQDRDMWNCVRPSPSI